MATSTNLCETLIKSDIKFDCSELVQRGLESDGLIINRSDIDFSATTFDTQHENIIASLVLKSGKKGYEIQQMGNTPFTGVQTEMNVGTYRNTFTHTIPIAILNNTPAVTDDIIDGLANGSFVIILKNKSKGSTGNAEYQVYGYAQGLIANEITNEKYSEDTDGGWLVTLQETSAPKSAMFFFTTSATATATAYEALKTVAE